MTAWERWNQQWGDIQVSLLACCEEIANISIHSIAVSTSKPQLKLEGRLSLYTKVFRLASDGSRANGIGGLQFVQDRYREFLPRALQPLADAAAKIDSSTDSASSVAALSRMQLYVRLVRRLFSLIFLYVDTATDGSCLELYRKSVVESLVWFAKGPALELLATACCRQGESENMFGLECVEAAATPLVFMAEVLVGSADEGELDTKFVRPVREHVEAAAAKAVESQLKEYRLLMKSRQPLAHAASLTSWLSAMLAAWEAEIDLLFSGSLTLGLANAAKKAKCDDAPAAVWIKRATNVTKSALADHVFALTQGTLCHSTSPSLIGAFVKLASEDATEAECGGVPCESIVDSLGELFTFGRRSTGGARILAEAAKEIVAELVANAAAAGSESDQVLKTVHAIVSLPSQRSALADPHLIEATRLTVRSVLESEAFIAALAQRCVNFGKLDDAVVAHTVLKEGDALCLADHICIINLISSKDVFGIHFASATRRFLTVRMGNNTNGSIDPLRDVINLLRFRIGSSTVSGAAALVADLDAATVIQNNAEEHSSPLRTAAKATLAPLAKSLWESSLEPDFLFTLDHLRSGCPPLAAVAASLTASYTTAQASRKLTWSLALGTVILSVVNKKSDATTVSRSSRQVEELLLPPGMAMVLLGAGSSPMTLPQFKEKTGLSEAALRSTLAVLVDALVLHRDERTGDISVPEVVVGKVRKLRLRPPRSYFDVSNEGAHVKGLASHRRVALEAAIVRIMKSRRVLAHHELVAEVARVVTQFAVSVAAFKAAIEELLNRDFLVRDAQDGDVYHYVA